MDIRLKGFSELVTLMLAREFAVLENRCPGTAISQCATRIRERVFYYPELMKLADGLAKATPGRAEHVLNKTRNALIDGGVL